MEYMFPEVFKKKEKHKALTILCDFDREGNR